MAKDGGGEVSGGILALEQVLREPVQQGSRHVEEEADLVIAAVGESCTLEIGLCCLISPYGLDTVGARSVEKTGVMRRWSGILSVVVGILGGRSHDLSFHPADNYSPEEIWFHFLGYRNPCIVLLEGVNEVGVSAHVEVAEEIELCILLEILSIVGHLVLVNNLEVGSLLVVESSPVVVFSLAAVFSLSAASLLYLYSPYLCCYMVGFVTDGAVDYDPVHMYLRHMEA